MSKQRKFGTQVALDLATKPSLLSIAVACSVIEGVDATMRLKGGLSRAEWLKILEISATESSKAVKNAGKVKS